jgi:hypothetical protein
MRSVSVAVSLSSLHPVDQALVSLAYPSHLVLERLHSTIVVSPRASCVPLSTGSGKIQVRKASDQSILGYIRQEYDGQRSYTFGALANALSVQLGSTDSNDVGGAIDIRAVNGPDPAHPFVGAVGGSGGYNFNPGQLGCVMSVGSVFVA